MVLKRGLEIDWHQKHLGLHGSKLESIPTMD